METASGDYGAFMEKFTLPPKSAQDLPLNSLTFAIKEMYVFSFRATIFCCQNSTLLMPKSARL